MDDLETANEVLKRYPLGWDAADVSVANAPIDKQSEMLSRLKAGLPLVLSGMRNTRASLFETISKPHLENVTDNLNRQRAYIKTMREIMLKSEFNPDNDSIEMLLRETLIDIEVLKILKNETVEIDKAVYLALTDSGFTKSYNNRASNARKAAESILITNRLIPGAPTTVDKTVEVKASP
jgi:hypothetical protein